MSILACSVFTASACGIVFCSGGFLLRAQWLPFPLRHLKSSTVAYLSEGKAAAGHLGLLASVLGWGPLRCCLSKAEVGRGQSVQQKAGLLQMGLF